MLESCTADPTHAPRTRSRPARPDGGPLSVEALRRLIDESGGCTLFPETYARNLDDKARPFTQRTVVRLRPNELAVRFVLGVLAVVRGLEVVELA